MADNTVWCLQLSLWRTHWYTSCCWKLWRSDCK